MATRNARNEVDPHSIKTAGEMASILDSVNHSQRGGIPSIKPGKGYMNALLQKKCMIASPYSSVSQGFGGTSIRPLNIST